MKKTTCFITIVLCCISLSGCNLLSDASNMMSPVSNYNDKKSAATNEELKIYLEEWKVMKPAILNLVSLETDLQYLLATIESSDQALSTTTQLQDKIETEEEMRAYETMVLSDTSDVQEASSFDDPLDFSEALNTRAPEAEKFSEQSVFADETLLEQLKLAQAKPFDEINTDSQSAELESLEKSHNLEVEAQSLPKIANYLTSLPVSVDIAGTPTEQDTRTIDAKFSATSASNNPILAAQSIPANRMRTQFASSPKIDSPSSLELGSNEVIDSKFQQTKNGKVSKLYQNEISDPTQIVGVVPAPLKNSVLNLKQDINESQNKLSDRCSPSANSPGRGFALHLASYSSLESARKGWNALSKKFANELCGLIPVTDIVTVKNKQFYSLRVGGFSNKQPADIACAKLSSKSQYCRSIAFVGKELL
jgi:hypothetical protein